MNCVTHQSPGLWRHPDDQAWRYKDLDYWLDLARLLERGRFDGIFIADVLGVYDVYGGSRDAAVRARGAGPGRRSAAHRPRDGRGDRAPRLRHHRVDRLRAPVPLRAPDVDARPPHEGARRLERRHLLPRERRAQHRADRASASHDERYDIADEYLEVCYKLWEGSWEDDAVVLDKAAGVYADPARVHPIEHEGRWFQVPGVHLSEPSPQRTPVIYQAGASSRGRRFAGRHAEAIFTSGPTIEHHRAARRRDPRGARGRGPRARRRPRLHDGDGRRRRDLARRVGQARRAALPTAPTRRRSSCSRAGRAWTSPATTSTPR